MIDHVGIDVRDFETSKAFYIAALKPLGVRLVKDLSQYGAAGFGIDRPKFWIGKGAPSGSADEVHVCFSASSRAEVRAFYEAALAAGGRDHGAPGLRPMYHEHYYGAFSLDLDGYNIAACCHLPE